MANELYQLFVRPGPEWLSKVQNLSRSFRSTIEVPA